MSLQLAAQHLAAQGRGPDKQLVHMSPREVAGLQALAMAHGGSLTTNPDTGLPEAGFLDNLLPMIIGAGVTAATGGAAAPWMIGLGIGGLEAARTGNLQKGLLAGLGAYGGAGLFGALAGAGAGAAQAAGPGMTVANQAAPQIAAEQVAAQTAAAPGVTVAPELSMGAGATYPPFDSYAQFAPTSTQYGAFGEAPGTFVGTTTPTVTPSPVTPPPAAVSSTPARGFLEGMGDVSAVEGPGVANAGLPTRSSTFASRFAAMPTKDKFKYGLAALSPALLAQPEYKQPELDREQYRYTYTPGRVENPELGYTGARTGERTYFRPSYTRLAAGGPVENMSAANVYDMQHAHGGVTDMGVDMSTGMERMAEGGISGLSGYKGYSSPEQSRYQYTYDPKTQSYREVVPVLPPADVALPFVETGGYGGGDMGQGYGFGATSGQLGPGASAAEAAAIDAALGEAAADGVGGGDMAGGLAGQGASGDTGGDGVGFARGGISDLGDYSDGGRLLKGPGDGVSDSIPAMIGRKQPARLADGEFVVPARIVSELGNGSTDAGARKLYAMMDRIQKARGQTVGKGKVAKNSRAEKYLPA